jgi:hypothetical protein
MAGTMLTIVRECLQNQGAVGSIIRTFSYRKKRRVASGALRLEYRKPAVQTSGHVVSAGLQTGQGESNALPREPPLFHTYTTLQGAG